MPNELPIPGVAASQARSIELVRVWASDGKQYVSLATGLWDDPAIWGIMLVDLAKHIANAYGETSELDHAQALARLKEGFDAEWDKSTDEPRGRLA